VLILRLTQINDLCGKPVAVIGSVTRVSGACARCCGITKIIHSKPASDQVILMMPRMRVRALQVQGASRSTIYGANQQDQPVL
jgi:hypothetical protein